MENDEAQIRVSFKTHHEKYKVTETPFAVPLRLTRYGLSEVINHLLNLSTPIPFDFLIKSIFLRTSLTKHVKSNGISTEEVLEIEYLPMMHAPESGHKNEEPDWISCISGQLQADIYVVGCYDGIARVFDRKTGETVSSLNGHTKAIKGLAPMYKKKDNYIIVTASKDQSLRVHSVPISGGESRTIATCTGHDNSVECVAASPDCLHFVSGGWDGPSLVWNINKSAIDTDDEENTGHRSKRRKTDSNTEETMNEISSTQVLSGHRQCVSSILWPERTVVVTGSWDHSIRLWDPETGGMNHVLHGNKVVTSLACSPAVAGGGAARSDLIASGHPDHIVRLWDSRASGGSSVAKISLASHSGWVSSIAWSPVDSNLITSASYDGTVKTWDIRSRVPLFTIDEAHSDKVLAVDWTADGRTIISGGADKFVKTHNLKPEN